MEVWTELMSEYADIAYLCNQFNAIDSSRDQTPP